VTSAQPSGGGAVTAGSSAEPRWEVWGRRTPEADWRFVGEVHAPDREMALLYAKESFFRHGEGCDFAVRPAGEGGELVPFGEPDWLEFHTDKTYKLQSGYPLGAKRRRARERVAALGATIDRPRPPGRGVVHPPTDEGGSEAVGSLPEEGT
jgi:phenylacetate-CoA oxygenase PaaH subunit